MDKISPFGELCHALNKINMFMRTSLILELLIQSFNIPTFLNTLILTLPHRYTINDRSFGRMLYYMTRDYNSQFKLQEVEDFFRLYPEAGAGQRSVIIGVCCVYARENSI